MRKDDIGIVARGGDPLGAKDAARDAFTVATVASGFSTDYVTPRKKAVHAAAVPPRASTRTSRRGSAPCRSPT